MNKQILILTLSILFLTATSGFAYTGSTYSGTYFDASVDNTQAADGSGLGASTDQATATAQKLWMIRGFENEGTIYEADSKTGQIDAPMLVTTIPGLDPDKPYHIYVITWSSNGTSDDWHVYAGFYPDTLARYSRLSNSVATGAADGNRDEYEGNMGIGFADSAGNLKVYIDDDADNQRSWYDGLVYKMAFVPYKPQPTDRATNVTLSAPFSFEPMRDPNNSDVPDPRIVEHQIRINTNPALLVDPNFVIPAGQPTTFSPTLEANATYYWRVDEKLNDGSVVTGVVWTFETIKTIPDFNPPLGTQPEDAWMFVGETATLNAIAGTTGGLGGELNYQWYAGLPDDEIEDLALADDLNHITGARTNTLSIVVEIADEGSYYCVATNDVGITASTSAKILVKRTLAHWTLDEGDYIDGQYKDISGSEHHADPNGIPTFVEGIDGLPNSAVLFGDQKAWANAGTWNPAEVTGQITISLWTNWAGLTSSIQTLISKRDSYATDGMLWGLRRDTNGQLRWLTYPSAINITDGLKMNQWQQIVATHDGTIGQLYINGELAGQANMTMTTGTSATMYIGDLQGDMAYLFNGVMDDIQIKNYAMDAYEVAQSYVDVITDAVICVELPANDFNEDCKVDLADYALFALDWLECGKAPLSSCD